MELHHVPGNHSLHHYLHHHLPPPSPHLCPSPQVYAEPLGYWKSYYNLFDFFILLVSVVQAILSALQIGHSTGVVLRVVRGEGGVGVRGEGWGE